MQYSTDIRDAQNNVIETTVGAAPTLTIYSGSAPANCAAADTGTVLAIGTLPSDWMAASSAGVVGKTGAWSLLGQSGAGAGTPGTHFRIKAGSVCKVQGTFGIGQEMVPDVNSIGNGQTVTINSFSITRGNS
jgi:hypothetical protein